MTDAAPEISPQNAGMLEISEESFPRGLRLRSFMQRPKLVAACVIDEPFRVSNGEHYCAGFAAGDYILFGEHGLTGMAAERFVERYESAERDYLGAFEAYSDATGIHLEPVE